MADYAIRDARSDDAGALLAIYRPFVTDTAVSFDLEPPALAEGREAQKRRHREGPEEHNAVTAIAGMD